MSRTVAGRNTVERVVWPQQSTGVGHIWLVLRDPEKIRMITSVWRLWKDMGKGLGRDTGVTR